ncbi:MULTISPECIES: formylglycine-generating enzyme family protein [unclassified Microcoleus]|uniref:formylglycine-generating enzyme family protein n=1 Tax=unclassified Microcoleus TaxID=2642155 RepID=UPI002FCED48F
MENTNFTEEIELLIQSGLEGQQLADRIESLIQFSIKDGSLGNPIEPLIQAAVERMENVIKPMQNFIYPPMLKSSITPIKREFQYSVFEFDTITLEDDEIRNERKQARYFIEELGNEATLEMVYIPSGSFLMGASNDESIYYYENPQHLVNVPAFHIGKFEISQSQWEYVMQHNLSAHQGANLPVENVSWLDASEFCRRLSLITGRSYRLPSEAEWEYACRAGTNTPFTFGKDINTKIVNYWDTNETDDDQDQNLPMPPEGCVVAYSPEGIQYLQTKPVGSFFPNAFGLYDMHGNVYELCQDAWHDDYEGAPTDGSAWLSEDEGEARLIVIRGGSFDYFEDDCRSACRSWIGDNYRYHGTGFRVACSL